MLKSRCNLFFYEFKGVKKKESLKASQKFSPFLCFWDMNVNSGLCSRTLSLGQSAYLVSMIRGWRTLFGSRCIRKFCCRLIPIWSMRAKAPSLIRPWTSDRESFCLCSPWLSPPIVSGVLVMVPGRSEARHNDFFLHFSFLHYCMRLPLFSAFGYLSISLKTRHKKPW